VTPEDKARANIDEALREAGYVLQDRAGYNRVASLGVAVREFETQGGPADYLLFIAGAPKGLIEAKPAAKGYALAAFEAQSERYARAGLKDFPAGQEIRFVYESTGIVTQFRDLRDLKARSREIFSFHRPETLWEWSKEESTLRNRLKEFPRLDPLGLRVCQAKAIACLEESFAENKPRALIQMATGAGKTFAAAQSMYRALKFGKAKRILFLVDTINLGEQAEAEFLNFRPTDDSRRFPEIYQIDRLSSSFIEPESKVVISTIQRLYAILRGEDLNSAEETVNPHEKNIENKPRAIAYNPKYPPEFFDFIYIDECHRSIYNVWNEVIRYFDAFLVGLTATPDSRAFAFFNQNLVSEYPRDEAVLDGVNVDCDGIFVIETEIGKKGGQISSEITKFIETRERLTRKKRWDEISDDIIYKPSQLDSKIVNPTQIRSVVNAFKDGLKEIFSTRLETPKTILYAKNDSHADDIVRIIREIFGEGNDFCKKITYLSKEDPKSVLNEFRNNYFPRIAVTVDMIATGTDVKPVECLIFMRDVRSKIYFEQMVGRATRSLNENDLRKVTPSATREKLGFVIIDAIGVTKSAKVTLCQFERKPTLTLKNLMNMVSNGIREEEILSSLAGRLAKLSRMMTLKERDKWNSVYPISLDTIANNIHNAINPDLIEEIVIEKRGKNISEEKKREYILEEKKSRSEKASEPFNLPEVREFVENIHKSHLQIIDNINVDRVTFSGWETELTESAGGVIDNFAKFIADNRDSIEALGIVRAQNYGSRELTLNALKDLNDALTREGLSPERLWAAYAIRQPEKVKTKNIIAKLSDIVPLIRFELGQTLELISFADSVKKSFQNWLTKKKLINGKEFCEESTRWLYAIRDYFISSFAISPDKLNLTPFSKLGGLGKFYDLFGSGYKEFLEELNYALIIDGD
jgi:type I restriction enzyme R subunit